MSRIKDLKAYQKRRSERMALVGLETENRVKAILLEMKKKGKILGFNKHTPNSVADRQGKDFTVLAKVNGEIAERSFGVTISHRNYHSYDKNGYDPSIPQFLIPIEAKTETIEAKILGLFP